MTVVPTRWQSRHLFDVRIDAVTTRQVLEAIEQSIASRQRLLITVLNAAKMVHIERDHGLRRAVLGADLILADGMSIVWACGLLRTPLPERVTGIDLMDQILAQSHRRGHRIYLLGATDEVLARVRKRIAERYPDAVIAGYRNGYFEASEEEAIAKEIAGTNADILLVAMSSPRKEKFIARWASVMNVPVCHGVGGAFDVFAGKTRRAPRWVQTIGMEWAYRTLQEPGRLLGRYVDTNTVFALKVAGEGLRRVRRKLVAPQERNRSLRKNWIAS